MTVYQNDNWALFFGGLILGILVTVLLASRTKKKPVKKQPKRTSKKIRGFLSRLLVFVLLVSTVPHFTESVNAETTAPLRFVYNGHLLTSAGAPVATEHTMRFSYWTSTNFVTGDVDGAGAINTGAATYASWQELHTFTPDANGYFSLQLGSVTSLPDFSSYTAAQLQSLYLQVEVKTSGALDTTYELLDSNPSDATIDRSSISSVPFALNADKLDRREIGTGSGSIPLLGSGGLLPKSTVPAGTMQRSFVIDANDTATGSIALQFGTTLAKKLIYDTANGRFTFNDDVRIEGTLTVTGLINGIDLSTLSDTTGTQLKVSSGAGLNVSVAAGGYRLGGTTVQYAGGSNISVTGNATNSVFFGSGGIKVQTNGYPTDEAYIPLASVVTSGVGVTTITDQRVMQNDDREQQVEDIYHAEYPNAGYVGDGSTNVGQLSIQVDDATQRNFYQWTSTRSTLQDYDVLVPVTLPSDFKEWKTNPITFTYRTSSTDATVSAITLTVSDTALAPVTLSGALTNAANTSWTTSPMAFQGSPTWTAGSQMQIRIKLSSKNNATVHAGTLKLKYVRLLTN